MPEYASLGRVPLDHHMKPPHEGTEFGAGNVPHLSIQGALARVRRTTSPFWFWALGTVSLPGAFAGQVHHAIAEPRWREE